MKRKFAFLIPATIVTLASSAHAAVALIDFGRNTNTTVGYNNVDGPVAGQVLVEATTGANTPWTITTSATANIGAAGSAADVSVFPASVTAAFALSARQDSLFTNSGSILTVSFGNLSLTNTYELFMYGSRSNGQNGLQTWTLTAGTGNAAPVAHNSEANTTVVVNWTNLVPDATGNLAFTLTTPSGGSTALNAVRLTSIPEPSTALLGALGALALIRRRR